MFRSRRVCFRFYGSQHIQFIHQPEFYLSYLHSELALCCDFTNRGCVRTSWEALHVLKDLVLEREHIEILINVHREATENTPSRSRWKAIQRLRVYSMCLKLMNWGLRLFLERHNRPFQIRWIYYVYIYINRMDNSSLVKAFITWEFYTGYLMALSPFWVKGPNWPLTTSFVSQRETALLVRIAEFSSSRDQSWASRQAWRLCKTARDVRCRISFSYMSIAFDLSLWPL